MYSEASSDAMKSEYMINTMAHPILIAMSGGVDSSVAALLLKREGLDAVGVFMRNGVALPTGSGPVRSCCGAGDAHDARRVADRLGIPFYVLDFAEDFDRIMDAFCASYDRGETPNPCILCNRDLKFGRLYAHAGAVGAEAVATGHYARVERRGDRFALRRGADPAKDQSYVLFPLSQAQLARVRFPLGESTKAEVRALAREAGLPVMDKPESMEICFVPGDDYRALLRERIGDRLREGDLKGMDGRVLGRHPGYQCFTIGQRHGLGIALGRPAYVVRIEPGTNTVVIGEEADLMSASCAAREVVWGIAPTTGTALRAAVQIRSQHRAAPATVVALDGGRAEVRFDAPQRAVTPGQAAVFYDGEWVVGGGWIEKKEEGREKREEGTGKNASGAGGGADHVARGLL
jgi:tRNA-specific 2-thiouridylase